MFPFTFFSDLSEQTKLNDWDLEQMTYSEFIFHYRFNFNLLFMVFIIKTSFIDLYYVKKKMFNKK